MQTHPDFPHAFIRQGWGFDVGQNFARASKDTPLRLAPGEFHKPGFEIGYIPADPSSNFRFLKYSSTGEIRVHVRQDAIGGLPDDSPAEVVGSV